MSNKNILIIAGIISFFVVLFITCTAVITIGIVR